MNSGKYLPLLLSKEEKSERKVGTRFPARSLETSPTTPEINQAWFFSIELTITTCGTKKPREFAVRWFVR